MTTADITANARNWAQRDSAQTGSMVFAYRITESDGTPLRINGGIHVISKGPASRFVRHYTSRGFKVEFLGAFRNGCETAQSRGILAGL